MANYQKILKSTATYGTNKPYVKSQAASSASPLTTKGDVFTFSTSGARLGVGTNGQVLQADSTETTGLKWVTSTSSNYYVDAVSFNSNNGILTLGRVTLADLSTQVSPLTTKGDIWVFGASANVRLPVGTNSYALVADSSTATGLNWAANSDANYYTSAASMGTNGILTGTVGGGGSNWVSNAFNVITDEQVAYGQSTSGLTTGSANFTFDGTDVTINNKLYFGDDANDYIQLYGPSNRFDFITDGSPRLHIDAGTLFSETSGGPSMDLTPGPAGTANYGFVGDTNTGMSRSAADTLHFLTAGVTGATMDSSQNVGIGTTTPGKDLDVNGHFRCLNTGTIGHGGTNRTIFGHNNEVNFYSDDETTPAQVHYQYRGGAFNVSRSALHVETYTANSSDPRVGIGTSSPSSKLHVVGDALIDGDITLNGSSDHIKWPSKINIDANGGMLVMESQTSADSFLVLKNPTAEKKIGITFNSTGNSKAQIYHKAANSSAGDPRLIIDSNHEITMEKSGTEKFRFDDGSIYMAEQASAEGDIAAFGQLWVKSDTPNKIYFTDDAGTDFDLTLGATATGTIGGSITDNQVAIGASTANSIEGSANLTYDGTKLTIARTADNTSRGISILDNEGTETISLVTASGDQGLLYLQGPTGGNAIYLDGGTNSSYINAGKFGIGTTAPAVKLDVRDAGWPIAAFHGTSEYGTGIQLYNTHTTDQAWAILGGGTSQSNYPLKFYDQTNSVYRMVLDNTGKLGIGTTSPSEHLHVESASNTQALFKSTDNRGLIQVADDDTTASIVAESSTLSLGLTSQLSASNLNILSDGAVGVGTTSPASYSDKFSIKGTSTNGWPLGITNSDDSVKGAFRTDATDNYFAMATKTASDIRFFYNDAEANTALIIKGAGATAGNVGIGTTAPGFPLSVSGTQYDMAKIASSHAAGVALYLDADGTGGTNWHLQSTANSAGTGGGKLDFVEAGTSRMVIAGGGNVGIGTTAPSYPLHVNTTSTSYAAKFENDSSNGYVMQLAASDSTLNFQTDHIIPSMNMHLGNDNVNFYMRTAGYKFGVGTSSPKTSMSLVGALSIEERADHETTTAGWGQLWVKNTAPNKLYFTDDAGTDFDLTLASTATGTIGGSITDNQVAIGASTANSIEGASTFTWDASTLTMTNAGNTAITLLGDANRSSADAHAMAMRGKWNGTTIGTVMIATGPDDTNKDDGQILFYTASAGTQTERMRIDETGNIGIGTTAPAEKLSIVGGNLLLGTNAKYIQFVNNGGTQFDALGYDGNNDLVLNTPSDIIFKRNGTQNVRIKSNDDFLVDTDTLYVDASESRVGIGTTAPSTKLDVVGTITAGANSYMSMQNNEVTTSSGHLKVHSADDVNLDANSGVTNFQYQGAEKFRLTAGASSPIIFQPKADAYDMAFKQYDATEVMRITDNARVGIGTTAPDYKLDVRHAGYNVFLASGQSNGNYPVAHFIDSTDQAPAWFEGRRSGDPGAGIYIRHNPASPATNNNAFVRFQMNDAAGNKTNYAQVKAGIDVNTDGSEGGNLQFHTSQAGSFTEQMRIDDAGNVGIGTTSPGGKLEIATSDVSRALLITNAKHGVYSTSTTAGYWGGVFFNSNGGTEVDIAGSTYAGIFTGGNVGIGATAPEGVLHTAHNSGVNIFQRSNDSASYGTNLYVRKSRGTVGSESNTQSGDLIGQMAFSPYYGDYDNYAASISSAIEGTVTTDTTPGRLMFSTAAAGANTVTERMRIDSAGNVGIGTTAPSNPLHIAGHGNPLRLQGTSTGKVELGVSTSGDFTIDSDDDIRLDAGGQDITLKGAGTEYGRLTNSSSDFVINNSVQDKDLIFKGNDGGSTIEAMRIDYSTGGRLGIGTTAPDTKLHVLSTTTPQARVAYDGTYFMTTEVSSAGSTTWTNQKSFRLSGAPATGLLQIDQNKIALVRDATSAASNMIQLGDGATYDQFSIAEDQRGSTATNGFLKLRAKKSGTAGYRKLSLNAVSGSHLAELMVDSISTNEALRFDTETKSHALDIAKAGYVSIGASVSTTDALYVNGNTAINGVLSATAKSFNIPHPLYNDKRLVHGSLEGPEHGLYTRGTIEASNGGLIELPEYWSAMCKDYTVQLTPHGPYTVFIEEKQMDKIMVGCTVKDFKFDYYIVGARTDETLEVVQDG